VTGPMNRPPRSTIPALLLSLSLAAIACLPCRTATQLSTTPTRTVPVSTRAAEDLVSALTRGIVPDWAGRFTLIITEEQLTSYVALNMQESIVDPQILLSDGSIHINGTLVSPIGAPVSALATVQVGETGTHFTVESVSVGGFPMPETFVEAFAQQVDDLIRAMERIEEVEIVSIEISEGKMIVQGTVAS
jgi:hypothetical protein